MDLSSIIIVEHTIFSLFNEIQMVKSIIIKKKTYTNNCMQAHTDLAYEFQQC